MVRTPLPPRCARSPLPANAGREEALGDCEPLLSRTLSVLNRPHAVDRRRHCARRAALWRNQRHSRADDAQRGRHLALCAAAPAGGFAPCCSRATRCARPGARLDDHLGNYAVEAVNLRAAGYLSAAHAVHGVTHLAALCRLLPSASRMRASMASFRRFSMRSMTPSPSRRDRPVRARFFGRARLWARPFVVRGDRHARRSHLRLAPVGPRGVRRGRSGLSRQAVAASGIF